MAPDTLNQEGTPSQKTETQTNTEDSNIVELTPSEQQASSQGWVPKERWIELGHDPEDWKPAKVFIEHGELISRIRSQSKESESLRQALTFANNQNVQAFEKGYQNALSELRVQKREAISQGDLVKADLLDEKIETTKEERDKFRQQAAQTAKTIPQNTNVIDPEHQEWVKENPWYDSDIMLQGSADKLAQKFIVDNKGQVTAQQVRNYVSREIRKEFPDRVRGTRPQGAPNPDDSGRGASSGSRTGGSGTLDSKLARAKADMTETQRGIMKTIMRSTGMSEKKYLEMYSQ